MINKNDDNIGDNGYNIFDRYIILIANNQKSVFAKHFGYKVILSIQIILSVLFRILHIYYFINDKNTKTIFLCLPLNKLNDEDNDDSNNKILSWVSLVPKQYLHNIQDIEMVSDKYCKTEHHNKRLFKVKTTKVSRWRRFYSAFFFLLGYYFDFSSRLYIDYNAIKNDKFSFKSLITKHYVFLFIYFNNTLFFLLLLYSSLFKKLYITFFLVMVCLFFGINEILTSGDNENTPIKYVLKKLLLVLKAFNNTKFVKYLGATTWIFLISLSIILF